MPGVAHSPQAQQDLAQIADYLANDSPQAAIQFLDATEEAFGKIDAMPELGSVFETRNSRLSGIRVWPIRGFENYLIFYRTIENQIEVVRVVHGARDLDNLSN